MSVLSRPYFYDEAAAFEHVEAILWPQGPVCPACGNMGKHYKLTGVRTKPSKKNPEGIERHGLYKCAECRKQFTVRMGTIFEESHLPLHKWLQAVHLMCSSKKGISAHQLHRVLEVTYKTAWFLAHRIREAMRSGELSPMGAKGKFVEADTTYIGGKEKSKHVGKRNPKAIGGVGKQIVHTLVERGGSVRSHHVADVSGKTLGPLLFNNVDRKSALMTDTGGGYYRVGKAFARHEMVDHSKDEYVRGDAYSNTVENYFSILKRGVTGVYQNISKHHLHRYLAEFDFRYTNRAARGIDDNARAFLALSGVRGRRLTYRVSPGVSGA
ncbi:IS1595 family transposase [Nitratireductor sp. ZSWI3]|uniref:IS1595 family transposase n=1 Tax=Nitratireductor sp. ZSWI3 TaxID=2966359 RepID=UPI0021500F3D|nr:IS1595 family transposase [Nitratireductor sp. ZSWI3]MCR4268755.1 IS1595 family transposase [Nitratireductor sp. ZSWI3]